MPLHGFRHSHAILLLETGVSIKRLGHSSTRVTLDNYRYVVGGLQEAAAQRVDEFLSEKRMLRTMLADCWQRSMRNNDGGWRRCRF